MTATELPSVGALVVDVPYHEQAYCTGTLITDRLVLTAAHCLDALPQGTAIGFFFGAVVKSDSPLLAIADATKHPSYVGGPPPDFLGEYYDIAVLRLAEPSLIPPMKLIRPSELEAIATGQQVLIAGYGQTDPVSRETLGIKSQGTTSIGAVAAAELWLPGENQPQKCHGDSGSPTIVSIEGAEGSEQRLIGVASRAGEGCLDGSVETRVDPYLLWIHGQGDLPCGSGLSPDCEPAPPLAKVGEPCADSAQCEDKLCLEWEGARLCRQSCLAGSTTCPAGTLCLEGTTGQSACLRPPEPPEPPTPPPPAPQGGCSLAIGRPAPPFLSLLLPLLAVLRRRQRREWQPARWRC